MSMCNVNQPALILYEIDAQGIRLPDKYNENNLVSDMLLSLQDESNETPLVTVMPDNNITTIAAPTTMPTTSSILPTTPSELPLSTSIPSSSTSMMTAEYFTNNIKYINNTNYLLFIIILIIFIVFMVFIIKNK
jgi:hypothetical protein